MKKKKHSVLVFFLLKVVLHTWLVLKTPAQHLKLRLSIKTKITEVSH